MASLTDCQQLEPCMHRRAFRCRKSRANSVSKGKFRRTGRERGGGGGGGQGSRLLVTIYKEVTAGLAFSSTELSTHIFETVFGS